MNKRLAVIVSILFLLCSGKMVAHAEDSKLDKAEEHNWIQSSVDYTLIDAGEHEYNFWKNFMKYTRTCLIQHRIKTIVYYCDKHNHTKSETTLEEVIHSEKHRMK
ncbi:hypothetical protein [Ornithinibacillus halotolerans]|uniref:Uncharacterized protein n=1 Tax=Ornithinibacillus halotolerans TaxID=1274357 RepID=A0A916RRQ2_9BACI|nr:hypothetical protein [Ornithinibacillus halotolerans]GGA65784.1 hypothetical protein GCM10008025_07000 [Ornithinibacillus halotolerans]